ncbi:MAG: hypothetical protein J6386_15640 [Candidatus Synoicihabitans palmerolidicus]|nr:hypothetical protein [Candidatus Synoicihabitans palmerolidicus]
MHLRAPTSAIGSRKSAQKSAFLPPFQNQGKWDTLYMAARDLEPTRYTWKAEGSAILEKLQRARTTASLHSVQYS